MKPPSIKLSAAEGADYLAFRTAVSGKAGHIVTGAFTRMTPGIDWRNCSKQHMAEEFAIRNRPNGLIRRKLTVKDLHDALATAKANYDRRNPR